MKRYIALLRGINVGGKNKIAMPELKTGFTDLGYVNVVTYLNSGNVVFTSDERDKIILSDTIESMIKARFGLDIPTFIILQVELQDVLNHAPDWWGEDNKEIYDNLVFMFPSLSYDEFFDEVGCLKEEYEKAQNYNNAVFWSYIRKDYQKTNWWTKTTAEKIKKRITIRTANTARKVAKL